MKLPKFTKNQWIGISSTATVLIVGFATIYFQQTTTKQYVDRSPTKQYVDRSPGSINTMNQTGGTNISYTDYESDRKLAYYDVSHRNALGLPAEVDPSLILTTATSKLITPFVTRTVDEKTIQLTFQCTPDALVSYRTVISKDPQWPFAYYYLGACEKKGGYKNWRENIENARQILQITTSIGGHYGDHDFVLEMIERDYIK